MNDVFGSVLRKTILVFFLTIYQLIAGHGPRMWIVKHLRTIFPLLHQLTQVFSRAMNSRVLMWPILGRTLTHHEKVGFQWFIWRGLGYLMMNPPQIQYRINGLGLEENFPCKNWNHVHR